MSESSLSALYLQNPQLAIALRRRLESEQQLQQGSSGEPVRHWAQGVNRLAQGLLGGYGARKADEEIQTGIDAKKKEVEDFHALAQTLMEQQGAAPQGTPMQAPRPMPQGGGYVDRVIGAESGGNPNARNPMSSATGAGQFIDSTWLSLMQDHPAAAGKAPAEILSMRADPNLSREMVAKYAQQNGQALGGQGLPVNDATQYLAHWFGPQGAAIILKAPAGTPMSAVMPAEVMKANPNIANLTTDGVLGLVNQKMGGDQRQQMASLPMAATDAGSGGVPRETPPAIPAISARPENNQTALRAIIARGKVSDNVQLNRYAAALETFLKADTPNLQTVNVGGEVRTFNPRTGTLGPALGSANEFTPKPQAVVDQAREIGAPYPELPRTPERMSQELALRPPTTLSPGQTAFGQNGQPIASVPNRPQSVPPGNVLVGDDGKPIMNNPDRSKDFQQADALRGEYTKLTADYRTVQDAHQKMLAAASKPSGAGDMALIFGIMKMLDPGSTVREGEYATAQNSGSVPERITAMYNKAIAGERLAETVRQDFLDQGNMIFTQQRRTYDNVRTRFEDLAKSFGLDPKQVTIDYVNPPQAPAPVATPPGQPVKRSPDNPLGLTIPGAR